MRIVGGRYHGGKLTCPLAQVQMSKQGSAPPPSSSASLPLFEDPTKNTKKHFFMGPESYHRQPLSMTPSLTNSVTFTRLGVFDVTLACEDGNYKIVEIVTVVDVVDEDRVGSSLLQI